MTDETTLRDRANDQCELCGGDELLQALAVEPRTDAVLICETCRTLLADVVDDKHWQCLNASIWSEEPAVKVLSWRVLHALRAASWARDLIEQAYLDDDTLDWAKDGIGDSSADDRPTAVDSNGTVLADGDSVTLIKDLDVKGAGFTAKRGTLVKGIRLTHDPGNIEGRVNNIAIVLKTQFLKKA